MFEKIIGKEIVTMFTTGLFHNTNMNTVGKQAATKVDAYVACTKIAVDSMDSNMSIVVNSLSDVTISIVV